GSHDLRADPQQPRVRELRDRLEIRALCDRLDIDQQFQAGVLGGKLREAQVHVMGGESALRRGYVTRRAGGLDAALPELPLERGDVDQLLSENLSDGAGNRRRQSARGEGLAIR